MAGAQARGQQIDGLGELLLELAAGAGSRLNCTKKNGSVAAHRARAAAPPAPSDGLDADHVRRAARRHPTAAAACRRSVEARLMSQRWSGPATVVERAEQVSSTGMSLRRSDSFEQPARPRRMVRAAPASGGARSARCSGLLGRTTAPVVRRRRRPDATTTKTMAGISMSSTPPSSCARTCRPAAGCPTRPAARCTSAGCRWRGTGRSPCRPAPGRVFSNRKMSCIVMTSPSMPVISEMAVTLRVPSRHARHLHDEVDGRRDLLADGRSGMFRFAIATIVSRRYRASRGCWRGSSSGRRRGRCSSPAACRAPRRRGPRRR